MLDPFMLFKLPLMAYHWWVRKVGAKTIWIGLAISTIAMLLFGWWESNQ